MATRHAPFDFASPMAMGQDVFARIPNGIPALEERVDLLLTCAVSYIEMPRWRKFVERGLALA